MNEPAPSAEPASHPALGAGWLEKALDTVRSMLRLPPGWDSYGARAIDPQAAELAERFLRDAAAVGLIRPAVLATTAGGIQIEWHTRGVDVEIEILASGRVRISQEDPVGSQAREWESEAAALHPTDVLFAKLHDAENDANGR